MNRLCYQQVGAATGVFMPVVEAGLPIEALALQRGYGVFDFFCKRQGRFFHIEDHIRRFKQSAANLHLKFEIGENQIIEIATELCSRSNSDAVRVILAGGSGPDVFDNPYFFAIAEDLPRYPAQCYSEGISLATYEFRRELPQIKTLNYITSIYLEPWRINRGVDDILYYLDGLVSECPRANFFTFFGDTLVTAAEHVLLGINRSVVIELARDYFAVEEAPLYLSELSRADEAFITGTSKGVMPVTKIDGMAVGNGKVGERTKRLIGAFSAYVEGSSKAPLKLR